MSALGKVLYEIPNRGRWEILRSYIPDMIPSETMVYEGVFLATDVGFEVIIAIAYLPFAWDGYFPTNPFRFCPVSFWSCFLRLYYIPLCVRYPRSIARSHEWG